MTNATDLINIYKTPMALMEPFVDLHVSYHGIDVDGSPSFLSKHNADFVAGWVGGCMGLVVGHPFDTIKVRQQTAASGNQLSMVQCIRSIMTKEGPTGYFKGMAFPLGAVGFLNSIFFGVYGNTLHHLPGGNCRDKNGVQKDPSYTSSFIAGGVAGAIQGIFACPIELIKVKLQVHQASPNTTKLYSGPFQCAASIYNNYGIRGLFRGFTPTILREIPGFSVYIASYQALCDYFTHHEATQPSIGRMFFCGGITGSLSWAITMPIDIIKSRMQADSMSDPKYRNTLDCAIKCYRAEGMRVFFKGLPIACIRAFPTNAVTFVTYSMMLRVIYSVIHSQDMIFDDGIDTAN